MRRPQGATCAGLPQLCGYLAAEPLIPATPEYPTSIGGLDRFCVIEKEKSAVTGLVPPKHPLPGGRTSTSTEGGLKPTARLEPAWLGLIPHVVVTPPDADPRVTDAREKRFIDAAGLDDLPPLNSADRVQVAVLDDLAREEIEQVCAKVQLPLDKCANWPGLAFRELGKSHGLAVAATVQDAACTAQKKDCPISITPFRALDTDVVFSTSNGSLKALGVGNRYGDVISLIRSMARALRAFAGERLVMNASVGMDQSGLDPVAEEALREALVLIQRQDQILVVASAGNRGGGPTRSLRTITAPGRLEVGNSIPENFGVLPVSAVDYRRRVLGLSRVERRSQHRSDVAYAAGQGAAPYRIGNTLVDRTTYTGTSISAALVSGIAAAIWSCNRDWTDERLRQVLINGPTDPVGTDIRLREPNGSFRPGIILASRYIAEYCSKRGATGGSPGSAPLPSSTPVAPTATFTHLTQLADLGGADHTIPLRYRSVTTNNLPSRFALAVDTHPVLLPQPPPSICQMCRLNGGIVELDADSTWDPKYIELDYPGGVEVLEVPPTSPSFTVSSGLNPQQAEAARVIFGQTIGGQEVLAADDLILEP